METAIFQLLPKFDSMAVVCRESATTIFPCKQINQPVLIKKSIMFRRVLCNFYQKKLVTRYQIAVPVQFANCSSGEFLPKSLVSKFRKFFRCALCACEIEK